MTWAKYRLLRVVLPARTGGNPPRLRPAPSNQPRAASAIVKKTFKINCLRSRLRWFVRRRSSPVLSHTWRINDQGSPACCETAKISGFAAAFACSSALARRRPPANDGGQTRRTGRRQVSNRSASSSRFSSQPGLPASVMLGMGIASIKIQDHAGKFCAVRPPPAHARPMLPSASRARSCAFAGGQVRHVFASSARSSVAVAVRPGGACGSVIARSPGGVQGCD